MTCYLPPAAPRRAPRAAMALSKLSGDEQRILFTQLCNVLEPRLAVYGLPERCQQGAAGADAGASAAAEG